MNVLKNDIIKGISATIFSLALLFPIFLQFSHTLEGHDHATCADFSTHIHEKQLDCSICDFHFSIFNFSPAPLPEFSGIDGFKNSETHYILPEFDLSAIYHFLRGPPQLS